MRYIIEIHNTETGKFHAWVLTSNNSKVQKFSKKRAEQKASAANAQGGILLHKAVPVL